MSVATYSTRVDATLDSHISRWLWLWLANWPLAIRHCLVIGRIVGGGTWMAWLGPIGPTIALAETPSRQPAPGP